MTDRIRTQWLCIDCGHRHEGAQLANICIGCVCPHTVPTKCGLTFLQPDESEHCGAPAVAMDGTYPVCAECAVERRSTGSTLTEIGAPR